MRCPVTVGKSGKLLKATTAYRMYGCRCGVCKSWGRKPSLRTCKVDTCTKHVHALDLCVAHYQRLRKTGDVRPDEPVRKWVQGQEGCKVGDCQRDHAANGFCQAHQTQFNKYGVVVEPSDSCAMCGREEDLCIDHCHETGKVRGVLCRTCNSGIGMLNDDPDLVEEALTYLRKHST